MSATIFFTGQNEIATLTNTFLLNNVASDPTTISCVITDPTGNQTTHTYQGASPADIAKVAIGEYQLEVACTITGLWAYVWIGTGNVSDIQAGTWTVQPSNLSQFYCSVEELKDRLRITDTQDDMSLQFAVQSGARWVEAFTGRHFYQLTEARTYQPLTLFELSIDDIVSISAFNIDRDGDGVYEESWTQGTDYQLEVAPGQFNQMVSGEMRPYTRVHVIGGGQLFPFIWPYSPLNRVKITGTWGWPEVPYAVKQAALIVSADFYKLKDAPFGVAGSAEFGMISAVAGAAAALDLLTPYISPKRKVGV